MVYGCLIASLLALLDFVMNVLSGMIYTDGIYGWLPLFTSIVLFYVYRREKQPYILISNGQMILNFKGNPKYAINSLKLISENNNQILLKNTSGHKKPVIKIPLNYLAPESQRTLISFVHKNIEPV